MVEREFADILKEYLKNENMSQTVFAERTGFSSGQISEWFSGKVKPGYDNLKKIISTFDAPATYWLGFTDTY